MGIWWSFLDDYVIYFKNHAPKYQVKGKRVYMFKAHFEHFLHFGREGWVFGAAFEQQQLLGERGGMDKMVQNQSTSGRSENLFSKTLENYHF